MADELYVGIDVGGTSVKIGVMTKEGGVKSVLESADVDASLLKGIGLAVPCPVPADGNISVIANLSLNLLGVHDALQASFPGVYVGFLNDANAAAMGELWRGAGAGYNSLVLVTLGTGIGAGAQAASFITLTEPAPPK